MYKKILQGLHKTADKPTHNPQIRQVASDYAQSKGFNLQHTPNKVRVNPKISTQIANAYQNMEHDPKNPEVQSSYNALINETADQFNHMKKNGLKISKIKPGMANPYKTSKDLFHDIKHNNHMWFFPTESGFGQNENNKDCFLYKAKNI